MATASDNFNRADGAIGSNWTVDEGSINVVSNVAEPQTVNVMNRARYTATPMDSSNHYAQALIGGRAAGDNQGAVTVRQASSTWTLYSAHFISTSYEYWLRKVVAGAETTLGTYASGTGAHTVRATANGSTISMDIDGTERVSVTDTAIASGTYAGIEVYSNPNGRWDDWTAADLAAASATNPGWQTSRGGWF